MRALAVAAALLFSPSAAPAAEFVSKDKGFAAAFPIAPAQASVPAPPNAISMTQWTAESAGHGFVIIGVDWKPGGDPDADAMFDTFRDAMVAQAGSLVSETYITSDGRPGRELRLKGPQGVFVVRLFYDRASRRTFNVLANATGAVEPPDLAPFVRSFRFLDRPAPQSFSSLEDGVSVTFPGPATTSQQETPQGTNVSTSAYLDGVLYLVSVLRSRTRLDGDPQARLDGARDGALKNVSGGRLLSERRLQVGAHPARHIEVDAADGQRLVARLVLDQKKDRLHVMIVAARPKRLAPEILPAFFDSFRLLE